MKLLVISSFPPKVSPEVDHAYHLCEHLAAHGIEVHVLAQKGAAAPPRPGLTVYPWMQTWGWTEMPRLRRLLRSCAPDAVLLVYVYGNYNQHPMITFLPTLVKRLLPGRPVVTLFEDADGLPYWTWQPRWSWLVRKMMKRWAGGDRVDDEYGTLLRDSDRFILVSDRIGTKLQNYDPAVADKSAVVPIPPIIYMAPDDGVARRRGREELGVAPDETLIAYFGYIYQSKGIETLLRAFHLVWQRRGKVRLILIGGSFDYHVFERSGDDIIVHGRANYLEDMKAIPQELGFADRVTWTGGFEWNSEMPSRYLRAADLCVLPYDGGVCVHSSSFTAVAAHGLPVLSTWGETLDPEFRDGENIALCPPQDPEAMAKVLELLLDSPEWRDMLRAGVLQLAHDCFSWDKAVKETLAAFHKA